MIVFVKKKWKNHYIGAERRKDQWQDFTDNKQQGIQALKCPRWEEPLQVSYCQRK